MPRVVAKIADLGLLIVATYSVLWLIQPKPDLVYSGQAATTDQYTDAATDFCRRLRGGLMPR